MSSFGRVVLVGLSAIALGVACAKGTEIPSGGSGGGTGANTGTGTGTGATTSSGSHTGGGGAAPTGEIGSPCSSQDDCKQGNCTAVGSAHYCTQTCPPTCPQGTYCSLVDGTGLCVPDLDQQCDKCGPGTACKLSTDACLTAPAGDSFCARDCSVDGLCPNGFTCLDGVTYAGDAGTGGGVPNGQPYKWCVPNSGLSCPCNDKRDGATRACAVQNQYGTCKGSETCNGKTGAFEGCNAATPAAETCNGQDDDCSGAIDDGDPNAMCAGAGEKPEHTSWTCKSGACKVGPCDTGWTSFPTGVVGCPCQVDTGEPNGTCATATHGGSVSDTGGSITLAGHLSNAVDVDMWSFDTVDTDEATTNSYHVSLTFAAPTPNDEFVMDVMRGDPCDDTPSGPSVGIVAYDWCVNGSDGASPPTGEGPCGPSGPNHCGGTPGSGAASGSHSAKYYVRVYRKPGATESCAEYQITVTASGAGCDFAQKCQ